MGLLGKDGWDDISVGKHKVEILDAERSTSSKGNPQVTVRMLVDGKYSHVEWFSLTPQAMFRLRSFLRVLGFSKGDDPEPEDLAGEEFEGIFVEDDRGRVVIGDWRTLGDPEDYEEKAKDEDDGEDLSGMTLKDLTTMAEELGIDVEDTLDDAEASTAKEKKAALITAIETTKRLDGDDDEPAPAKKKPSKAKAKGGARDFE